MTELGQENRKALKSELADLSGRLADAERGLAIRDKTIAELNEQREEREVETTARIEKFRETESKLVEVEVKSCFLILIIPSNRIITIAAIFPEIFLG